MDRNKRKSDKRNIDPSSKVKRCLFGKPDDKEEREIESKRQKEVAERELAEKSLQYDYDFKNDCPSQPPNPRYIWEKVEPASNNNSGHQRSVNSVTETNYVGNDISFDRTALVGDEENSSKVTTCESYNSSKDDKTDMHNPNTPTKPR